MARSESSSPILPCVTGQTAVEVNFDCIAGPNHNYAGLSLGNIASQANAGAPSNPRRAALAGLEKMRRLMNLGLPQAVLLPQSRPDLAALRSLGFRGSPEHMCATAWSTDPLLFVNMMSSSAMWAANTATVSPSADAEDGRMHITPANLASMLHRSWEAPFTHRQLSTAFADPELFDVHFPLPGNSYFSDEGAANHGRLAEHYGAPGVELFVYGENGGRFPARQTRRACEAISRLHRLAPERTIFLEQSRRAIDAGAFHNDVMGVTNGPVLIVHEAAFEHRRAALDEIKAKFPRVQLIEILEDEVPLGDLVESYLLNSQLVMLPGNAGMALILATEAWENRRSRAYLSKLTECTDNPIREAIFVNVTDSMRNGGGPACLRLRVVLTPIELAAVDRRFLLDEERAATIERVVRATYPEDLGAGDLNDPTFHRQCFTALDELGRALGFSGIYDFQAT